MPQLMNSDDVGRALRRIAHEILERHSGAEEVALIGIRTRGVHLAESLRESIEQFEDVSVPFGELDITPFRDDRHHMGVDAAHFPGLSFDVTGKSIVLVDDVLFTGRTVRAALDAVTELGRAGKIELAVLVDRGHRELPVRPDYVGKNLPTALDERVSVHVSEVDGDIGVWIERTVG